MGKGEGEKAPANKAKAVVRRTFFAFSFPQSFPLFPVPLLSRFVLLWSLALLVLSCGHPPPGRGTGEVESTAQSAAVPSPQGGS